MRFDALPAHGAFDTREKLRLAGLVVALVALLAVFALRPAKVADVKHDVEATLPASIAAPRIRADEYRRTALDATREQRVSIERPALELAFADARTLSDEHFAAFGGSELDAQRCSELVASSDASRGKLVRARGRIAELAHLDAADGANAHWRGRLELEDGASAFFAVLAAPPGMAVGDFVRIDGLFLKVACESLPSGWLDAPLIVAADARRSSPALGRVTALSSDDLARDDELALWKLVAYARDVEPGSIDWDAAPLLDAALLARIDANGAEFRGRPVRIAAANLQALTLRSEDENPARVERMTHGWLGSWAWTSPTPRVVEFVAPRVDATLRTGDELAAHAFFFANRDYASARYGQQHAPLLVVQAFERADRFDPKRHIAMLLAVALVGVGFALGFVVERRDAHRSAELRLARTRRRRARRAQSAPAP